MFAIASTTGTILGQRHISCRPFIFKVVFSYFIESGSTGIFGFIFASIVFCSVKILGTGFIASLKMIVLPFEIPPKIPPALLERKFIFPS